MVSALNFAPFPGRINYNCPLLHPPDDPNKNSHSNSRTGGEPLNEVQVAALQANDSVAAIMQNVPVGLHKFLNAKPKNVTRGASADGPTIDEIKHQIYQYNDQQLMLNEESFGPLLNDSVIIVVQVSRQTFSMQIFILLRYGLFLRKTKLL